MNVQKVISRFGGTQESCAAALGVTQGAVSQWVQSGRIPLGRQYQIQVMTDGEFRAEKPRRRKAG